MHTLRHTIVNHFKHKSISHTINNIHQFSSTTKLQKVIFASEKDKQRMSMNNLTISETLKFNIPPNALLDFCVTSSPIQFKLTQGKDAEIHGYPLKLNKTYIINSGGVGIHSWYGCQIELSGIFDVKPKLLYVLNNDDDNKQQNNDNNVNTSLNPIKHFLHIHSWLNGERRSLEKLQKTKNKFKCVNINHIKTWSDFEINRKFIENVSYMGPRILILGPSDSGKSTLCKSFINYAARMNDKPIFIDLDIGQNSLSIPGVIGGDIINDYYVPWKAYDDNRNPFIYYTGNISPTHQPDIYKHYISILSIKMKMKMLSINKTRYAGSIINTSGFIDGYAAFSFIKHIILSFNINAIVIIDYHSKNELIQYIDTQIKPNIKNYNLSTAIVPKPEFIAHRTQSQRRNNRQEMCRNYFYGNKIQINPMNDNIDTKLKIIKEEKINIKTQNDDNDNNNNGNDNDDKDNDIKDDNNDNDQSLIKFIDEYNPFQRAYSFNEFIIYEITPIKTNSNGINGNNSNSSSSGGSSYSNSASSSSDIDNNNNKLKLNKKNKHKKNQKRNKKPITINYQYYYADNSYSHSYSVQQLRFRDSMIGHMIAVTHAQDVNELLKANIAGFLYIKDIDFDKKEVRVLQTCVGPLPGLCLYGNVIWDENSTNI